MLFSFPAFQSHTRHQHPVAPFSSGCDGTQVNPGNRQFALLMLSLSIWSFASILRLGTSTSQVNYFGRKFISGAVTISPLWFLFTAEYTNQKKFLTNFPRYLVWLIPSVTLIRR
jgi:hypothetical protein